MPKGSLEKPHVDASASAIAQPYTGKHMYRSNLSPKEAYLHTGSQERWGGVRGLRRARKSS